MPGKTGHATVLVKVANREERDPEFPAEPYEFRVEEDEDGDTASIGQPVGTVSCLSVSTKL